MQKPTVLEIVQTILTSMDGDYVNSIDDTEESQSVAQIVKNTFRAMQSNRNWSGNERTVTLIPSTNNLLPTHMTIKEEIKELLSIFYDKHTTENTKLQYREVKWKEPDEFLRYVFNRNSEASNTVTVTDPSGVKFLIINDKAPDYYTSFDDNTLVFDSWDSSVDTTLQASKTLARAYVIPEFILSDSHIPDLPEEAFAALIEEATSVCQFRLKQFQDLKAEQEASRQQRWLSRKEWRVKGGVRYPNYGRRQNRYRHRDPTFDRNN